MRKLRIALAQINPTVGDLGGNTELILRYAREAESRGADVIAFPELAITGYPPEDLLFKRQFLDEADRHLERIVASSGDALLIVGAPHREDGKLYNGAAIARGGELVTVYHKVFLPNYGVFDELRYFEPGRECPVITHRGVKFGVGVCEDIWYDVGTSSVQRAAGAEVAIVINGSPYYQGRGTERQAMLSQRSQDLGLAVAYVNMVGGQDELVFDGQSLAYDHTGRLIGRAPQFEEALLTFEIDADAITKERQSSIDIESMTKVGTPVFYTASEAPPCSQGEAVLGSVAAELDSLAEAYAALVIGTRDYVEKSGFRGAVIGLSGGIDSALTTMIAVDALGADRVTVFFMPSQFTADQSAEDSAALAQSLGVRMVTLPIRPVFDVYLRELESLFDGREPDVTEENIQARVRGNLLMAASNKFGWIVLTTGNKSEMATGYSTLYGDLAGGFAVIKDVPKTLVWELSCHVNSSRGREVIPRAIIDRPPTAELRPDQKDEDSLPSYAVLDPILKAYIEEDSTVEEMLAAGMPPAAVEQAIRLVDRSEYKRRQAPPGVKITPRAFGRDWRLPIVNRFLPRMQGPSV